MNNTLSSSPHHYNKIAALQSHLAAITPGSVPEQNLKSVLSVLTDVIAANAGDVYTASQTSTLEGIADQCRYAGGYGVVLARIALKKNLAAYDNEAMCPPVGGAQGGSEDRSQDGNSAYTNLILSPNPAANTLRVSLPDAAFSKGELQVWNTLGIPVRTLTLQPGNNIAVLDLSGLPDGNYMVEVIMDNQRLPVQHFVKYSR